MRRSNIMNIITGATLMLSLCSCNGDDYKEVTYKDVTLSISPENQKVAFDADTVRFTVTADGDWSVMSESDFCKVSQNGGISGTTNMYAVLKKNVGSDERTAILKFHAGNDFKDYEIIQGFDAANAQVSTVPAGYKLVWNDEFEGNSLGNGWTIEQKASGWVNNELQNYIKGAMDGTDVIEVKNDMLNINCFKAADGKIYSGRLYAKEREGWKYGYFEARIKLPKGKGTWPAFWMMPANNDFGKNPWPGCGEIDIMEEVGVDPNVVVSTVHCNKYNNGGTAKESGRKNIKTAESEFHIYAMEWTASKMDFYVDGDIIFTYKNDGSGVNAWPFNKNFYIILNLAWGGVWGGMNGVDESALPIQMQVDYVRVYQKDGPQDEPDEPQKPGTLPAGAAATWKDAKILNTETWYMPDWATELNTLKFSQTGDANNSFHIEVPTACNDRWQAQCKIHTNLATIPGKSYTFKCKIYGNQENNKITLKLVETGVDGNFVFDEFASVDGDDTSTFELKNLSGIEGDKLSLIFDFGYSPEGFECDITDIEFYPNN